jgi:4a-hydroxytetrahydrobiopterin dehydratase
MIQRRLSEADVREHMKNLPGWSYIDHTLTKQYNLMDFTSSIRFVNQVAVAADSVRHHPDIYIRYNKVTLTLTTHESDGVTIYDIQLAASCDDISDAIQYALA